MEFLRALRCTSVHLYVTILGKVVTSICGCFSSCPGNSMFQICPGLFESSMLASGLPRHRQSSARKWSLHPEGFRTLYSQCSQSDVSWHLGAVRDRWSLYMTNDPQASAIDSLVTLLDRLVCFFAFLSPQPPPTCRRHITLWVRNNMVVLSLVIYAKEKRLCLQIHF